MYVTLVRFLPCVAPQVCHKLVAGVERLHFSRAILPVADIVHHGSCVPPVQVGHQARETGKLGVAVIPEAHVQLICLLLPFVHHVLSGFVDGCAHLRAGSVGSLAVWEEKGGREGNWGGAAGQNAPRVNDGIVDVQRWTGGSGGGRDGAGCGGERVRV